MISYLIIDDEPIAHRIIEGYCQKLKHLKKSGNCFHATEAMEHLHGHTVDLVFLDMKMPGMSGFELLKTLSTPPKIIVTSAYKEHALEGYEWNVVDYLLKPFSFDRFVSAVNKVQIPRKALPSDKSQQPERIAVKGDREQHLLNPAAILYIEAFGNYCKVHLAEKTIITLEKISTFEELLGGELFIRIHKSFLVATQKVASIRGNRLKIGTAEIPIGQTYRHAVKRLLQG